MLTQQIYYKISERYWCLKFINYKLGSIHYKLGFIYITWCYNTPLAGTQSLIINY